MATSRLLRVIDDVLSAAAHAVSEQDWDQVLDLCEDVLAVDPDNHDAAAMRLLAERHVGRAIPAAGRRHLAVLFVDLVGSTALGEELDPEAYLEVIRAYETACRPLIDRYGGHINRFAGDGLVAFFGFPHAHEDDSRRATLAGLAAQEALRRTADRALVEHGIVLAARMGVHTGLVVVGDRGSADWRGRDDAFGPTVNMAARLQTAAAPGTVVVSDAVALLVGSTMELVSRGRHDFAGVPRPVEVFEVLGPVDEVSAAASPGSPGSGRAPVSPLPELVGRRRELDELVHRLDRARTAPGGTGRVVLLRGEPGIGKSRLLAELLEATAAAGGRSARLQCSPHQATSSLHPLRGALQRYAGITAADAATTRLDKLAALVEGLGLDPGEVTPYLAIPLSLEVGGRFDPVQLDAVQLKEALMAQVLALVERLGTRHPPFVLAVEDVQWADPMSLDLLERVAAAGPPSGLLVVLTSRSGPAWSSPDLPVDVIRIGPLPTGDVRRLAAAAAPGHLDDAALDDVARRSDGVPLYARQLVAALVAEGGPSPREIPLPLTELLQSRLDSVGAAKAVAQVAATIGRDFEAPLLHRVVAALTRDGEGRDGLRPDTVPAQLTRLVSSHLVDVDRDDPDQLRFHHALVRDAAYASQLHRVRARRHRAVADVLADLAASGEPVDAALVAHHHDRGGDAGRAIAAYLVAAERAKRRGGLEEALAHVERAGELLAAVPEPEALRAELGVCLARVGVTTSLGGWVAPGALDQYARALELCAKVADVSDDPLVGADAIRALIGIWTWYCTKGDLAELGEVSDTIERQLRLTPMAAGLPVLASCRGVERFYAGDFPASRRLLEQAVSQLATDDIPDWERWQIPNDPMAAAYAFLGPLRLVMGDEPGALAAIAAGLERSATLPPPHGAFSEAFVRTYEVWMHRARGALDDARRAGQELLDVTREHGELVLWAIVAQLHLAATEVMAEPTPAALGRLGAAISAYRGLGVEVTVPSFLLEQAAGHLALGEPDEAGRCVDDALSYADQRYARAEGLRLRAEVRAARSGQRDRRGVHGDLCEALRIATAQEAPFQLARVVDSYRRLVGGDPPSVRITTGMTRGVRSW